MPMEIGTMVALVISAVVVLFAGALISFPFICFYFWHRRRVLELKGTHAQQVSALQDRMENLELKCHKLPLRVRVKEVSLIEFPPVNTECTFQLKKGMTPKRK